ncbi:MAG: hypothetical protein KME17_17450, partial [Cyanosarcina radialis HA8281-LM2]|nr:hypothetical protein [Cyanosarcina radialis HA8281-LM2]
IPQPLLPSLGEGENVELWSFFPLSHCWERGIEGVRARCVYTVGYGSGIVPKIQDRITGNIAC